MNDTENNVAFGILLGNFINQYGLNQTTLAKKAMTSQPVISAICNGKRRCGLRVALKLADAIGLHGEERSHFLSHSKRPQWKGFDHEMYGYEAMLYDFVARQIKNSGIDSREIASITSLDTFGGRNGAKVVFVLKDGSVYKMQLLIACAQKNNDEICASA